MIRDVIIRSDHNAKNPWKGIRVFDAETGEPIAATSIDLRLDMRAEGGPSLEVKIGVMGPILDLAVPATLSEATGPTYRKLLRPARRPWWRFLVGLLPRMA